ncbi:MAG: Ig-like domain-containing protein [Pseudomonadota bacterium]
MLFSPALGALDLLPDGTWTYTPNSDVWGQDGFVVAVSDEQGHVVEQTVTVDVLPTNDAPTDIAFAGVVSSIDERDFVASGVARPSILLATLSAVDIDAGDGTDNSSLVYTVSDPRFSIEGGNQLWLGAGESLDFETEPSAIVTVTVTDQNGNGLSYSEDITFTVNDQLDIVEGTAGADSLVTVTTTDPLTGNVVYHPMDGAVALYGFAGDDVLRSGGGNDQLEGGAGQDSVYAGDGDDTVSGGDGDDYIDGGRHRDTIDGGAGDDTIYGGRGEDVLTGGSGDDFLEGGDHGDQFTFGDGNDTLSYGNSPGAVTVSLTTLTGIGSDAEGDVLNDRPEVLIGSAFGDWLEGSSGHDVIDGGAGDDTIFGLAGSDTLRGGAGNDTIDAGSEGDVLDGGSGNDVLTGGAGDDTYLINLQSDADHIFNYDVNTAIDVIGFDGIDRGQLWFSQVSGTQDLLIEVVGTGVSVRIDRWFDMSMSAQSNHRFDFILAGEQVAADVDVASLVSLMATVAQPTNQTNFDTLTSSGDFADQWATAWNANYEPVVSAPASLSVNEGGVLTFSITATDDFTPVEGLRFAASAYLPGTSAPAGAVLMLDEGDIVFGAADASGQRQVTIDTVPFAHGSVDLVLQAIDASGNIGSSDPIRVDVAAVNDGAFLNPLLADPSPAGAPTFSDGPIGLNLNVGLLDTDGSEAITKVIIKGLASQLSLNKGGRNGNGDWELSGSQLTGLVIQGPATWHQDLNLTYEVHSKENSLATEDVDTLSRSYVINAAPTAVSTTLLNTLNEYVSGATSTNPTSGMHLFRLSPVDADGDSSSGYSYQITSNPGQLFDLQGDILKVHNNTSLSSFNRESTAYYDVGIRVTDPLGLSTSDVVRVNVNNINERPGTPGRSQVLTSVNENVNVGGDTVANFSVSDVDVHPNNPGVTAPSLRFTRNDQNAFVIQGHTVKFAPGRSFNRESVASLTGTVVSDDGQLSSGPVSFTVNINDVNEFNPVLTASTLTLRNNLAVSGNEPAGTLSATDADALKSFTYSMGTGDDSDSFSVNSSSGVIQFHGSTDFEYRRQHFAHFRVSDGHGRSSSLGPVAFNVIQPSGPYRLGNDYSQTVNGSSGYDRIIGYRGNDTLYGGLGNDTYVFNRGDGTDTITEWAGHGTDTLYFNHNISWSNLLFYTLDGTITHRRHLDIRVDGNGGRVIANNSVWARTSTSSVVIDNINVNGSGNVNIRLFNNGGTGGSGNDTVQGSQHNRRDILIGYNGNDKLYGDRVSGNGTTTDWEDEANVFVGGNGNDTMYASVGHDVYVFDGFNGRDTITDTGGTDRIQFGRLSGNNSDNITINDLKFSTSGSTLYIGVQAGARHSTTAAWSMANYIKIIQGTHHSASKRIEQFTANGTTYNIAGQEGVVFQSPPPPPPPGGGGGGGGGGGDDGNDMLPPILLDLNRDGDSDIVGIEQSSIGFRGHGVESRVAWFGAQDGLLVLDRDGNGVIDRVSEVSFIDDFEGATTDMEGLRGFDSNGDNAFSVADDRWSEFQVWQDLDQNGVSSDGELQSLDYWGIESISLELTSTGRDPANYADSVIVNTAVATLADGSEMTAFDTFFAIAGSLDTSRDNIFAEIGSQSHLGTDSYYGASSTGDVRGLDGVDFTLGLELDVETVQALTRKEGGLDTFFSGPGYGEVPTDDVIAAPLLGALGTAGQLNPASSGPAADERASSVSTGTAASQARSEPTSQAPLASATAEADEPVSDPADGVRAPVQNRRSAVDDDVALTSKQRLQMVEAIAAFGGSSATGLDPAFAPQVQTASLLTSLPQVNTSV